VPQAGSADPTGFAGPAGDGGPGATALVLCGGASRRLGRDKLAEPLGDATVLDMTLAGLPDAWPVVAVGPHRHTLRAVTWTLEQPAGGGPLAGIAAGLALVRTDLVVVLAGDMPFAGVAAAALVDALSGNHRWAAVAARDEAGQENPLLVAYRTDLVRAALPDRTTDGRARTLLQALEHGTLEVTAAVSLDVDTPDRLAAARRRVDPCEP
jgi:molybdopterin-guanine dinucleotide biosynthesis protein A